MEPLGTEETVEGVIRFGGTRSPHFFPFQYSIPLDSEKQINFSGVGGTAHYTNSDADMRTLHHLPPKPVGVPSGEVGFLNSRRPHPLPSRISHVWEPPAPPCTYISLIRDSFFT